MDFSNEIIKWYNLNKRDLPWRNTLNPYKIWLSEIILQQTRVDQGLPYYLKFTQAFPSVKDLADAKEEKVLKLWQGLGYYSRARNLHAAAKQVINDFNGKFPTTKRELLKLKGVGDYTSSAIASFCFNEVAPVVDGNVYRLLSRVFGIETPIDSTAGQKEFKATAFALIDKHHPAIFNQAIMEFGALQCTPKSPSCITCPIQLECYAFNNHKIETLPYKSKKIKQRKRYFYYFYITNKERTYIYQRGPKDIWENLYEFPLIEKEKSTDVESILSDAQFINFGIKNFSVKGVSDYYKHILSHQILQAKFIEIDSEEGLDEQIFKQIEMKSIDELPTHRLMEKYLNSL